MIKLATIYFENEFVWLYKFTSPFAWSLSKVLTPLFHSSICSCRGLIRPSRKHLWNDKFLPFNLRSARLVQFTCKWTPWVFVTFLPFGCLFGRECHVLVLKQQALAKQSYVMKNKGQTRSSTFSPTYITSKIFSCKDTLLRSAPFIPIPLNTIQSSNKVHLCKISSVLLQLFCESLQGLQLFLQRKVDLWKPFNIFPPLHNYLQLSDVLYQNGNKIHTYDSSIFIIQFKWKQTVKLEKCTNKVWFIYVACNLTSIIDIDKPGGRKNTDCEKRVCKCLIVRHRGKY